MYVYMLNIYFRNTDTEMYALVMEYAEFGTLHDLWDLKEFEDLPLYFQMQMALQVAQALQHVRKCGIIHRGKMMSAFFLLTLLFRNYIIRRC